MKLTDDAVRLLLVANPRVGLHLISELSPTPIEPVECSRRRALEDRYIQRQQQQAERQHPEAKHR
jgi:hypothetical protein